MTKKSKLIICLLAIAVILFCVIQFWAIPAKQARQEEYARNQTDALTHDISAIEDYKSSYVGDASSTANLFYSLPLCNVSMKFQIDSETCALTVNYLDTVWDIGEEKVQRDLIYNSAAAMAAIDNLSGITYEFSGDVYFFDRERMEAVFGTPLSALLADKETWNEEVREQLKSADFVAQFYSDKSENLTALDET